MRVYQIMLLSSLFETAASNGITGNFSIERLASPNINIRNVLLPHTLNSLLFIKGGNHYGIYRVYNEIFDYGILLTDWRDQNNYYVIVCNNKMTGNATLEINKTDNDNFTWKYKAMKQDGKNAQRKALFASQYSDCTVELAIPKNSAQLDTFVNSLITLAEFRIKVDNLSIN